VLQLLYARSRFLLSRLCQQRLPQLRRVKQLPALLGCWRCARFTLARLRDMFGAAAHAKCTGAGAVRVDDCIDPAVCFRMDEDTLSDLRLAPLLLLLWDGLSALWQAATVAADGYLVATPRAA
jgi:hypothetical protein